MSERFTNNAEQAKCRCGMFAVVVSRGEWIDRVECVECGEQALWRDDERL